MIMVPIDHDRVKNPIVHCKCCGNEEMCVWIKETNDRLVANSMCFTCDFWEERGSSLAAAKDQKFPDTVVVHEDSGPMVYCVASEMPQHRGFMRGYGGSKFIIDFDDGRKMASSNMWSGQKIPTLWVKDPRFQPTARLRTGFPGDREAFLQEFDSLIASGLFFQREEEKENL